MRRVFAVEYDGFLTHDLVIKELLSQFFFVVEIDSTINVSSLIFILETTIHNGICTKLCGVLPTKDFDARLLCDTW